MRLTYEAAQVLLESKTRSDATAALVREIEGGGQEWAKEVADGVRQAGALAKRLSKQRMQSGSIDFDLPEVRVVLDAEGNVEDIRPRIRVEAHRLVEEFMLLANRTVAAHFGSSEDQPFVFRVHEYPDREKIRHLATYVRAFGHSLPHEDGRVDPTDLNSLLLQVRGTPEEPVIKQASLRAMSKAHYGIENNGHFGLGFSTYTHFTSPIRRYPDLIVHRLMRDALAGKRDRQAAGKLKLICEHSSERERVATDAERSSVRLKQVEYAVKHVGETHSGVVSGVSKFGVYIELDGLLVEGMVHVRDLDDDYYEYDERRYELVGHHSGRRFKLGNRVSVTIAAARPDALEVDFVFNFPKGEKPASGGSPPGRTSRAGSKKRKGAPNRVKAIRNGRNKRRKR